jgi:cobalamin biosynthesis protein CobT
MPPPTDLQAQQLHGLVVKKKKEVKDDIPEGFVWTITQVALKGGNKDEAHVLEISSKKNRFVLATLVPGRTEQFSTNVSVFHEDQPFEFTSTGSGEVHLVGTLELLPSPFGEDDEDDESDIAENGFLDEEASEEESDEGGRVTELPDDDEEEDEEDEEDEDEDEEEEEESEEEKAPKGKAQGGKPQPKPQQAQAQQGKKNKEAPGAAAEQPNKKQKGDGGKPQAAPQQQQKPQTPKPAQQGQQTPKAGQTPKGQQAQQAKTPQQAPKSAEKPAGTLACPHCPAKFNNPTALTQHSNAKHKDKVSA